MSVSILRYLEKALILSAFFYPQWIQAQNCPTEHYDETALVKSVHDGDTLRLTDGRKIRLIGIDTPELARNNQPAQPYADQARQVLTEIIKRSQQKIQLLYGIDRKDKYQRTLAHLYMPDGQNIQALMIQQGLATAFTTPPNDRFSSCYRQQEQVAIEQKTGIWSLADYQLKNTNELTQNSRGFRRLQGQVIQTHQSNKAFWITLDNNVRIRIRQQDLTYFDVTGLHQLKNKTIGIRGWLHPKKNGFFMNLRHPDALSLIPQSGH